MTKNEEQRQTLSRMVAPSLVMITSPLAEDNILSMPRGPRLVRTASATALAATMFAWRISSLRFVSTYFSVLLRTLGPAIVAAIDRASKERIGRGEENGEEVREGKEEGPVPP